MKTTELAMPKKAVSWPDLIEEIELNKDGWEEDSSKDYGRLFPVDKESSIRPAISRDMKWRFPDRKYSAKKELFNGEQVIKVRRIK